MPVDIDYRKDKHAVAIRASGPLSCEELQGKTAQTIQLVKQHATSRVFADYSAASLQVNTLDVFAQPERYKDQGMPHSVRIAVVKPRDPEEHELFEFYVDVTHNRGFIARLFETEEEAWLWLDLVA